MTRIMAAISHFKETLRKLRSTTPYSAEWAAAESNVQDARWMLSNIGLTEAQISELARDQSVPKKQIPRALQKTSSRTAESRPANS